MTSLQPPGGRRRVTPLCLLAAPLALVVAVPTSTWAAAPAAHGMSLVLAEPTHRVDGLSVEEHDDGTTALRLRGAKKPTFNVYRLTGPDRLVVDLSGSERGKVVPHVPLDTWACGRVTIEEISERGAKLVRVMIELKREVSYIVVPDAEGLVVTVTPRELPPEAYFARKSAGARRAELEAASRKVDAMTRDAVALKAEAVALKREAASKASEAKRRARAARAEADGAKRAEARAAAAERRAEQAEAAAAVAVSDAKSHKFKARRALKEATAERERAETERMRAQADRRRAQAELAEAAAGLELARKDLERKQSAVEASQRRANHAEAQAQVHLADAKSTAAVAKRTLADAHRKAQATTGEAERTLSVARKRAERTEQAARETLAAAEREAKAARESADQTLDQARRAAAQAEGSATKKLAAAQRAARDAESAASDRLAKAQREAKAAMAIAKHAQAAAKAADITAKKRLLRAQREADAKLSAAKAEVLSAQKAAAQTQSKAAESLVAAEREVAAAGKRAASIVSGAEAEAAERLRQAERAAKDRLAQAEATAATAEAAAKQRLATAQAKAEALVADARARAEEGARARLEAAEVAARAKIRDAEAKARTQVAARLKAAEAQAEQKLATAQRSAQQERIATAQRELRSLRERKAAEVAAAVASAHTKARESSKRELGAARRKIELEADANLKSAKLAAARIETEAAARVQKLAQERDAALAAASDARDRLGALESQRGQLERDLSAERQTAESLQAKVAGRERTLARLQSELAAAKHAVAETSARPTDAEVARAKTKAERLEVKAATLSHQVTRLQREVGSQGKRAHRAEAKLARLKQRGATKSRLHGARVAARAARAKASRAATELRATQARQSAAAKDVAAKQALVGKLVAQRATLEEQSEALRRKNAVARRELAEVEDKLTRARAKVAAERKRLAGVTGELQQAAGARASSDPVPRSRKGGADVIVRGVSFENDSSEERVVIEFDGPILYEGTRPTPNISVLRLRGAALAKSLERSLDATSYKGPIKLVTSFSEAGDAKIVVSTQSPSTPRLDEEPGRLVWRFPRRSGAAQPRPEAVTLAGAKVGGFTSRSAPAALVAPPAPAAEARRTTARRSRYRGQRIDIELQDAPVKDVLLLFSDIGRVNIIAGNGVEGSVTMKLNSVPWDQALDIILRSLNLGSESDGNVIRVATLEDLEAERRTAIERANARVQQKPLETRLVPVSYATVTEMIPKVQSVLSPRGTVTPDTRTNMLIIMDVSENVALAEQLVNRLDTQTPQVLIEARIVEARTNFTRQLGIQWGFDYTASPGTGNPTGLLFPNSLGLGGGATGLPPDTRGLILPGAAANPNYAVDLPAPVGTGSGGALGFSFGSISGNLNTNLRLSAAESTGEVRIISAPKIVTLDNSPAEIEQGVQIPISQVSAQGVNTRFVNAALSLRVTPHVTNEGAVLLDVTVQKNEADFINTGARGDPTILTKQAQSRMLVNDNDTAVIGGIYTRNKAVNFTKVPWIADIPIIGWFFKSKSEADTRSEVLIFLTPKIVNRASSIGE